MAKTTYPVFGEMLVKAEDLQLIVDAFTEEDRKRLTKDGVFIPGIVNEHGTYLQKGSNKNTLRINPFIGYTKSGNRIEVENAYDYLIPKDDLEIEFGSANKIDAELDTPIWHHYSKNYTNFTEASTTTFQLLVDELKPGSILQGVKMKHTSAFNGVGDVYVSIGTLSEPEKFTPKFLISEQPTNTDIETSNIVYCESGSEYTPIYATFTCSVSTLNALTSGNLSISLCITDVSNVEYTKKQQAEGGLPLSNNIGNWEPNTTFYIVARYKYVLSDTRSIDIPNDDIDLMAEPFEARKTDYFQFRALRRTGTIIDPITEDDIKLGKVVSDSNGDITIYINDYDENAKTYLTDYLSLPGYRFRDGINADQIASGRVTNEQFDTLEGVSYNIQQQFNTTAKITENNIFTGNNSFTKKIAGDIETVDGFHAYKEPTANSLLVLDSEGKIPSNAISDTSIGSLGSVYTVTTGLKNEDTKKAEFLKSQTNNTEISIEASEENPLKINYSNGTEETITEQKNIGGLYDDGKYLIIKDKENDFRTIPLSGGTKGIIPTLNSNIFKDGSVTCSTSPSTAYYACDLNSSNYAVISTFVATPYTNSSRIWNLQVSYEFTGANFDIEFNQEKTISGITLNIGEHQLIDNKYVTYWTPLNWQLLGQKEDSDNWVVIYNKTNDSWSSSDKVIKFDQEQTYKKFRFFVPAGRNINPGTNLMPTQNVELKLNKFQLLTSSGANQTVTESYVAPENPVEGSYWLDISSKPYKGYIFTNNEWNETIFTKVGEVTKNAGILENAISYSFNNMNKTNENIDLALNKVINFNHNIGIIPEIISAEFTCKEDDATYKAGDKLKTILCENKTSDGQTVLRNLENPLYVDEYNVVLKTSSTVMYVIGKEDFELKQITPEKWSVSLFCKRSW